jgi:hypothetical protein
MMSDGRKKFYEQLVGLEGQPVAILCARYWYRGLLKEVGVDHVVLSNPRAVEVTGSAQSQTPEREDPIPSDLYVRIDFMEIVCQPTWVRHEMSKQSIADQNEKLAKGEKIEVASARDR